MLLKTDPGLPRSRKSFLWRRRHQYFLFNYFMSRVQLAVPAILNRTNSSRKEPATCPFNQNESKFPAALFHSGLID